MLINITCPIFKCKVDRDTLFSRLREVSGFVSLTSDDISISLSLSGPACKTPLNNIQQICDIWGAECTLKSADKSNN